MLLIFSCISGFFCFYVFPLILVQSNVGTEFENWEYKVAISK
uniref:Uncharacterized protein n=1 Tax=Arundo donax TaxID=35708 RepID=A0A0A8Z882_ARUDO